MKPPAPSKCLFVWLAAHKERIVPRESGGEGSGSGTRGKTEAKFYKDERVDDPSSSLLMVRAEQQTIVGATGFEPATSWSQTKRSTGLSYAPLLHECT